MKNAIVLCLLALLAACGQKKVCEHPPMGADLYVPRGAEEEDRREREEQEQAYERCLREQKQVP